MKLELNYNLLTPDKNLQIERSSLGGRFQIKIPNVATLRFCSFQKHRRAWLVYFYVLKYFNETTQKPWRQLAMSRPR